MPFALPMSEPLTLTLADVLPDVNPFAELVAVMSPVEVIVPVARLNNAGLTDAVKVVVVAIIVPVVKL